jgi:hypothetical protein
MDDTQLWLYAARLVVVHVYALAWRVGLVDVQGGRHGADWPINKTPDFCKFWL